MNMKKKNLVLLVCIAVISGLILYWMKDLPMGTAETGYGPDFYPKLLLIVLGILGVILLIQTLLGKGDAAKKDEDKEEADPADVRHRWLMMAVFAAMGVAYALLLNTLGFIVISIIMVFACMKLMGGKWVKSAIISVVAVVALYAIFKLGFKVQLPDGILGGIL